MQGFVLSFRGGQTTNCGVRGKAENRLLLGQQNEDDHNIENFVVGQLWNSNFRDDDPSVPARRPFNLYNESVVLSSQINLNLAVDNYSKVFGNQIRRLTVLCSCDSQVSVQCNKIVQ